MNLLSWLEEWYTSICNGDWEHQYGITIETMDNPGWHLKINVTYTLYSDIEFDEVRIERTEHDWVWCRKVDYTIDCMGGPQNLTEMLEIVRKWMSDNKPDPAVAEEYRQAITECRKLYDIHLPV